MLLQEVECINFRNYKNLNIKINTDNKINIIVAPNGMGKSNFLETIYYMSYVRPFRNVSDKDLIFKTSNFFSINCRYIKEKIIGIINIDYSFKKKEILIDNKRVLKHSEVLGKLLTVLFSNDDIFIINGAQSIRRRYFNMFFSLLDPIYLEYIKKYDHLIKQKNILLKNGEKELLYLFDEQIAEAIEYIQIKRNFYINEINKNFNKYFLEIGFYNENVSLKYYPSIKNCLITKNKILEKIKAAQKTDLIRGYCTTGSHKDDYIFYINDIEFSKYGSFGQLRLASLIIKYVQALFYKEKFKTEPIYLLDDVILELDYERQKKFIDFLGTDNQLFITVTDKKYIDIFGENNKINVLEVKDGQIF